MSCPCLDNLCIQKVDLIRASQTVIDTDFSIAHWWLDEADVDDILRDVQLKAVLRLSLDFQAEQFVGNIETSLRNNLDRWLEKLEKPPSHCCPGAADFQRRIRELRESTNITHWVRNDCDDGVSTKGTVSVGAMLELVHEVYLGEAAYNFCLNCANTSSDSTTHPHTHVQLASPTVLETHSDSSRSQHRRTRACFSAPPFYAVYTLLRRTPVSPH